MFSKVFRRFPTFSDFFIIFPNFFKLFHTFPSFSKVWAVPAILLLLQIKVPSSKRATSETRRNFTFSDLPVAPPCVGAPLSFLPRRTRAEEIVNRSLMDLKLNWTNSILRTRGSFMLTLHASGERIRRLNVRRPRVVVNVGFKPSAV